MKRLIFILLFSFFLFGCEKETESFKILDAEYKVIQTEIMQVFEFEKKILIEINNNNFILEYSNFQYQKGDIILVRFNGENAEII